MEFPRTIHLNEDVPLNSNAPKIFLNSGTRNTNLPRNGRDGTVIHLSTGNSDAGTDLGLHINTTLSMASSKKMKLLILLNILLSVLCMLISGTVAFFYWNEVISMRKHLDVLKEQVMLQNTGYQKIQSSPLVYQQPLLGSQAKHYKTEVFSKENLPSDQKIYEENIRRDDLLVDSNKNTPKNNSPVPNVALTIKELMVIHFNGAVRETNMGSESIIGPWVRDTDISSPNSESRIELNSHYVTIKEGGLYLIYSQVVYLTQAPNCYFIWARQTGQSPRLLSTCATGDDSSRRALDKSQISCATQTVARLYPDDIVNIAQREQNRTLWLRPGYSYFGFIKLSS